MAALKEENKPFFVATLQEEIALDGGWSKDPNGGGSDRGSIGSGSTSNGLELETRSNSCSCTMAPVLPERFPVNIIVTG
jgi:hypothetical protein